MPRTVSEIALTVRRCLESLDASPLADLFSADAVYEFPFAPPGTPHRIEGRNAVIAVLTAGSERARAIGLEGVRVNVLETAEPGLVVELTAHGRSVKTGEEYSFPSSVGVLTVHDGEITSYRDYPNVAGAAVAMGTNDAREVFDRFLAATVNNRWDELADFYAEDAVIETPFAPTGIPRRSEGREGLRSRFIGAADVRKVLKAENVVVRETADPEVIVAEFDLHSELSTTGRVYSSTYILVITVQDGMIVHSRDYSSSAAAAELMAEITESRTGTSAE
ncbi:nuclear transport factor 2 family protein [Amycolatopsis sp. H20-H5]|uniref:nuclear transport factor 2 family protein n=1 Tax=Amycolatopsis sp. H20-H5 TaxID=3046309 RepID=UPI002DB60879|nr:nuclear transport factor 2 family protein [Amycolatopsis sp. H20-H5]MEC3978851.1 nuclear transport factor 2 family protein [Amycolatopsis sp. H20-H5]